jgi:hypothetical protein
MGVPPLERFAMRFSGSSLTLLVTIGSLVSGHASHPTEPAAPAVLVVVGVAGESRFAPVFQQQSELWMEASKTAGACATVIGTNDASLSDRDQVQQFISSQPPDGATPLWLVFIGHGTHDGHEAKIALRGADISASELAGWLVPFSRPLIIVNTTSASAPFINALSKRGRVIITATRSGQEVNYARLGEYMAAALQEPQADLDRDGQSSVFEVFLRASHMVAEFYRTEGRLATEHSLIDDNGDGQGTPAEWFRGLHPVRKPQGSAPVDGVFAHQLHLLPSPEERALTDEQRTRRDQLEAGIARLRNQKKDLAEDEYYSRLEVLLLDLAALYQGTNTAPVNTP